MRISRYFPLFVLPLLFLQFANAQSGVDVAIGFGGASAPSNKTGLDLNLNPCTNGTANCQSTPSLSNFMLGFRGDLMLWKHFGVDAEINFEPSKKDYVNLTTPGTGFTEKIQSRVSFWDFNGVLQPIATKRASVKLEGGIGGANIKFYDATASTSGIFGSQAYSQYFGSANHFQAHVGAGVQLYVKEHLFVRPQFDVHFVHNLEQFGRNTVVRYSVWLGYTFGGA